MTISAVSPTQSDPLYHATLTDGTTTVGLKFVNADGGKNKRAISKDPLNRLGIQMVQGNLSYASLKEPYTPETQVDWSGGRGLNHFHKDKSRFYDSNRANTWRPGQISLGPRETYGYGHRSQEFYLPGSVTWKSLTGTERFIAAGVEALTSDERCSIYFWIRRVGTPGTLTVRLRNNTSSAPGTTIYQTVTVTTSDITDFLSVLHKFEFPVVTEYEAATISFTSGTKKISDSAEGLIGFLTGDTITVEDNTSYNDGTYTIATGGVDHEIVVNEALTTKAAGANIIITTRQAVVDGTVYWVEISGAATDTATNHWEVGVDAAAGNTASTTKYSTAGTTTWTAASYDLYYRLTDFDVFHPSLGFFEYKHQYYCYTKPDKGAPRLYIQGDRGVCTGGQTRNKIVDTSKTWVLNEWVGCWVMVSDGTGSTHLRPWRKITSNTTGGALTLSGARWGTLPVASDTEYVILNSDKWTEITGHGMTVPITDVCIADKVVYFALGNGAAIIKMNERLHGSTTKTYTRRFIADGINKAYFLKAIRSPTKGLQIWKALNKGNMGGVSLGVSKTMEFTKDLRYPVLLADCETVWTPSTGVTATLTYDEHAVNNAAVKLAIDNDPTPRTGILAYYPFSAVDIRDKKKVRFWLWSTISISKNSLGFVFSESATCAIHNKVVTIPEQPAGGWHLIELPYDYNGATDWGNLASTLSIGLKALTSKSVDYNLFIDVVELVPGESDIPLNDDDNLITGMEAYGDPEIPWLFRQGSVGYVMNNIYHELPLPEMKNMPTNRNGLAHCVTSSPGPYLYWSYLSGICRYYRNNIDTVGPNLDDGLPEERTGSIPSLFAYPGCVYETVYANTDGYSSLLKLVGTSHHEVYRCNEVGARIDNVTLQSLPGFLQDKLWFTQGGDPVWICNPSNTLREETDTSYKYTHEASVETGWIYLSMFDASKFFNTLKLITRLASASMPIYVDYKTDEATSWSTLATSYTTSPSQEVYFNTTVPGTTGKRTKIRVRMYSNSVTATPYIEAWVMECLTIVVPKWSYTFQFLVADEASDIEGDETADRAETLTNQLETWAASAGSLTFNTIFSPMDSKTVRIAPYSLRPVRASPDEQLEGHVSQITLLEL